MKELEMLRNRYAPTKQQQQQHTAVLTERDQTEDSPKEEEEEEDEIPAPPPMMAASPCTSRQIISPALNKKEASPAKESYPGLHQKVRQIKVSPPKPGKLYPCLSDIEQTTENESSEESDDERQDEPFEKSCYRFAWSSILLFLFYI